jgi:hypothetical protein
MVATAIYQHEETSFLRDFGTIKNLIAFNTALGHLGFLLT